MQETKLIDAFQKAHGSTSMVVVEGLQALKHAVRFKAKIEHIVTYDIHELQKLAAELAPDISSVILSKATAVNPEVFAKISPKNHRTKVVALAEQKNYKVAGVDPQKPIVFLENPKDLENIGAVVRVAAAANAGAVVADSEASIWHPAVVRGGAGLQYSLPVFNGKLADFSLNRPLFALDPTGEDIRPATLPANAVFIFGSERSGITKPMLQQADKVLRLPMKPGVSSLNLATSVAATLYQAPSV